MTNTNSFEQQVRGPQASAVKRALRAARGRFATKLGAAGFCLVVLFAGTVSAEMLGSAREEVGQAAGSVPSCSAAGNAPRVEVRQPVNGRTYSGPFPVDLELMAESPGCAVDVSTLRVVYKKAWGIDITDRVRPYLEGNKIHIPELDLPSGEHEVEVSVMNQARVKGSSTIKVRIGR